MKVAVIQLKYSLNPKKNFDSALARIEGALKEKAQFVLLPEMFLCQRAERELAPSVQEKTFRRKVIKIFQEICARKKIHILAGSLLEIPKRSQKGQGRFYNTSFLIDNQGKVQAKYRKKHLFEATIKGKKIRESDVYLAGEKQAMGNINGYKAGLSICYDLRFPVLYKKYAQRGADLLCVPSSFTEFTGQRHWEVLLRARAIENFCYVLAPNQCGVNAKGIPLFGNSMIVAPSGKIMARAPQKKESVIYADVQKGLLKESRSLLGDTVFNKKAN